MWRYVGRACNTSTKMDMLKSAWASTARLPTSRGRRTSICKRCLELLPMAEMLPTPPWIPSTSPRMLGTHPLPREVTIPPTVMHYSQMVASMMPRGLSASQWRRMRASTSSSGTSRESLSQPMTLQITKVVCTVAATSEVQLRQGKRKPMDRFSPKPIAPKWVDAAVLRQAKRKPMDRFPSDPKWVDAAFEARRVQPARRRGRLRVRCADAATFTSA